MKVISLGVTVAAALSLTVLSAALAADEAASRSATVTTARTNLGRIIVDGGGRTLYLFEKDRRKQRGA
jgi:predicted lipoprotein with Yx(FWY)xxD motif